MSVPQALLSVAEMAAADAAAAASGLPIDRLMEAAGRAVADLASYHGAVTVLCGPGNNGGDGYVAARILRQRGVAVTVHADTHPADGAAARAAGLWTGGTKPLAAFQPHAEGLVIDALFGAGLSRPIDGEAGAAILRLNASGATVIAVDVPSGLDGDTGQSTGPVVRATRTVTFFCAKPGHHLWPGRALCGQVLVAPIGLGPEHLASPPRAFANTPALWQDPALHRGLDAHKYQRGHCLVISGPELRTGAARLAGTAALHAGAGAVTLAGERAALKVHAAQLSAIMLAEAEDSVALADLLSARRFDSAVCGPASGLGDEVAARIAALIEAKVPLVLDADGLTVLTRAFALVAARIGDAPVVLTPHAGEFARLFEDRLAQDEAFAALPARLRLSKLEQARAAARLSRAVVVFKGIDSVIAAPDGPAAINGNAGPELATAGSGDVLAGLIGAHLAQGMPAFEAAAAAVWLHGAAGASFGSGLTADRLAALMRPLAAFSAPETP